MHQSKKDGIVSAFHGKGMQKRELRNAVKSYDAVVIGASAGGMNALLRMLPDFPAHFPAPIIIVQHIHRNVGDFLMQYLNEKCRLRVKEADEKERILGGTVYIAPANYHLLIEHDRTFTLTIDEKVNYSRPSIDVLFESAAYVYRASLIGVILTGANADGAKGLNSIKAAGGITLVQDPLTAEVEMMPRAAMRACQVDYILPLEEIPAKVVELVQEC